MSYRTREELAHQVSLLLMQGTSSRAIARTLGISRNTARALFAAHETQRKDVHDALPRKPTRAPRARKTDRWTARIAELLRTYPTITKQRVFETLTEEGFDGGYSSIKRHMRTLHPPPKPKPSLETPEHPPGHMAESDWSPYQVPYTTGLSEKLQVGSYVLRFSTRKHLCAYRSCDLYALMDQHRRAFQRFGGVARECIYDSQKPVVLRWEGTQPIYNPRFLSFAAHYGFRPAAVRGKPNAKARVERGFWEHELSFLNGRSFRDLDDFNTQLEAWLDRVVDVRVRFGTTAIQRFEQERAELLPLPLHPYDTARVVYRVCGIDGYVAYDGNFYAVPYDHVTDILPLRITQAELFVYSADFRVVAHHELALRGRGQKLDPNGLHPRPERHTVMDLDRVFATLENMGVHCAELTVQLRAAKARVAGHDARRLLGLRERFDTAQVEHAVGHALRFGVHDFASIARILALTHRPRTLDEYVAEATEGRLSVITQASATEPRDLAEYDQLPTCGTHPGVGDNTEES